MVPGSEKCGLVLWLTYRSQAFLRSESTGERFAYRYNAATHVQLFVDTLMMLTVQACSEQICPDITNLQYLELSLAPYIHGLPCSSRWSGVVIGCLIMLRFSTTVS